MMDLSTLTIREIFAQLTIIEDALQGRTEQRPSASRRRLLEQQQDRLCQELRSRVPEDLRSTEPPRKSPPVPPVPA
ncbi:hypothetical protein MWU75_12655 [Ornithinimicrobium sp. F0845]|uniref:hypothetical protein n=1 Tax=Ornithinimicrobium sp. F0845 TaxID=2926412 RepID=UPI001FF166F4|nr:hypothetical protein [Ornithinimicrobium sp. F0845]MCK0112992.1 hypothetical protein [Ornithinimicrobium sp. F0845]